MVKQYIPLLGDIIWVNFDPSRGKEIKKARPALVVSSNGYNQATGMVGICPITSTDNKKPHFIPLSKNHRKVYGCINPLQIRTIDYRAPEREVRFIEKATQAEMGYVVQYVQMIFNYDDILSN
jgi:mRNA interferase MazF